MHVISYYKTIMNKGLVNIGCGTDVSIKELAELIVAEVGYEGQLVFDTTKPDGTPRKLMDTSKINNLGWIQSIDLKIGIKKTVLEVINSKIF
jgi:GDP-L-fucose synthase